MQKIHVCTPYSVEKKLGNAYNECMRLIPDNEWCCLIDYDVQFLTPDAIYNLHQYVELFPNAGIFTCFTNRLHPLATNQLLGQMVSDDPNILNHILIAEDQRENLFKVTELNKHISGFLMMIRKETWNEIKFSEDKLCLGVDNDFSDRVLKSGRKILRMEGIYVFHQYRMLRGIKDKSHLI